MSYKNGILSLFLDTFALTVILKPEVLLSDVVT